MLDFRDDSNRAKYFVSSSVFHLYEILKAHLYDRIYYSDEFSATFSYNWYHFVSYSLFVLRCAHVQTDDKAYKLICLGIDDYLRGNSLGVDMDGMLMHDDENNYINNFGQGKTQNQLPDSRMIKETTKLYNQFIKIWNQNYNDAPYEDVESYFEKNFMVLNDFEPYGTDFPDFSGSFDELFNEYNLDGDDAIKLFNCRRKPSDKPRFYEKKYEGFKID